MDTSVQVAVISACASVIVAAVSFALTKRQQRADQLRDQKLNHYKVLLSAISDLATHATDKDDANRRFALAVNTIALVAPQSVIDALMSFHDEVKYSNPNRSSAKHDELLVDLLLGIRESLELPFKDDPSKFRFHLVGAAPQQRVAEQGDGPKRPVAEVVDDR